MILDIVLIVIAIFFAIAAVEIIWKLHKKNKLIKSLLEDSVNRHQWFVDQTMIYLDTKNKDEEKLELIKAFTEENIKIPIIPLQLLLIYGE